MCGEGEERWGWGCVWGSVDMNFDFLFCGPSHGSNIAHENRGHPNVNDRCGVVDLWWGSDDVELCSALVDFLSDLQAVCGAWGWVVWR